MALKNPPLCVQGIFALLRSPADRSFDKATSPYGFTDCSVFEPGVFGRGKYPLPRETEATAAVEDPALWPKAREERRHIVHDFSAAFHDFAIVALLKSPAGRSFDKANSPYGFTDCSVFEPGVFGRGKYPLPRETEATAAVEDPTLWPKAREERRHIVHDSSAAFHDFAVVACPTQKPGWPILSQSHVSTQFYHS